MKYTKKQRIFNPTAVVISALFAVAVVIYAIVTSDDTEVTSQKVETPRIIVELDLTSQIATNSDETTSHVSAISEEHVTAEQMAACHLYQTAEIKEMLSAGTEKELSSVNEQCSSSSITNNTKPQECEPKAEKVLNEEYIVPASEYEIGLMVQLVQHEVNNYAGFFPGYDYDYIQQLMAKVVVNRVGIVGYADSIYDVITQPGSFCSLEELAPFDSNHETTRKNVLTVLRGEDNISNLVRFEMSFPTSYDLDYINDVMTSQVGPVNFYFQCVSAEPRLVIFAEDL